MTEPLTKPSADRVQSGVQSVEVGLRLLGVLIDFGRPVMLKELAGAAGMPAAKVHRYLVSLIRAELVDQDQSGGHYRLGRFALTIGLAALAQLEVNEVARDAVAELRDRSGETCFLAVWGNMGATIVDLAEGRYVTATLARVGRVVSTVYSATGRLFAAYLPKELTRETVAGELPAKDRNWFTEILAETRTTGLGRTIGGEQAAINAISAPVFDHAGNLAAAITMLGPARRFPVDLDAPHVDELREVAKSVTQRLGGQGQG